ncbi:hypothetical protein TBLA_0A03900 [Henningerozyma blattae CBS 6284]|uniref:RING-type domain-containing protein n=1 Tax=Henningerozyma blattae (strain ATCC 34711 / CBS 6284 / DSM 70876 / NBRC 10599 / NRRL Y-10934 / UCD 77-7) TaxID=1071380 RepID=I2GVN6_HENB6|nr:hypothetical protein TBLA_0A03900 [Tetrapisispora blattae CBS 6284]CCH58188.1 hypothetical protein TBLA_0A03900 [Tetrapisispora blattae CBS 6284]
MSTRQADDNDSNEADSSRNPHNDNTTTNASSSTPLTLNNQLNNNSFGINENVSSTVNATTRDSSDSNNNSNTNNSNTSNQGTATNTSNLSSTNIPINPDHPDTRNITVSIQYSLLNPQTRLTTSNNMASNFSFNPSTALNGSSTSETPDRTSNGSQLAPDNIPNRQANGTLVLSFRDVPVSTPSDTLESVISVAAELATRRFVDIMTQSNGISQKDFENLSILKLNSLPTSTELCSICMEPYEEEPSATLSKKRSRDLDRLEDSKAKKPRSMESNSTESNSTAVSTNSVDNGIAQFNETTQLTTVAPSSMDSTIPTSSTPDENKKHEYHNSPVQLSCKHIFCRSCLYEWSKLKNSCPLCRKKIVETPTVENNIQNDANSNEAFERIRRILYNNHNLNSETNTPTEGSDNNTTNPSSSQTGNSTNGPLPMGNSANSNTFSMSRSGIVILRPTNILPRNPPTQSNNQESNNSSTTNNTSTEGAPANSTNVSGIRWVPIPVTFISLNNGERPNTVMTPNRSNSNTASTNANSNGNTQTSENTNDGTPNYSHLRSMLNHVFNTTDRINTQEQNTSNNDSNDTTNSSNNNNTSLPGRMTSLLSSLMSASGNNRNADTTDINNTTNNVVSNPPNTIFTTGVASYRSQDGEVRTVNLHGNENNEINQSNIQNNTQTNTTPATATSTNDSNEQENIPNTDTNDPSI